MGLFDIFKKKNNKEDKHMSTLEEVRKAYEDLSDDDKKTFSQSITEQASNGGSENGQTAEADEQKSTDEEHVEGQDVASGDETNEAQDGEAEDAQNEAEDWRKTVNERFERIEAAVAQLSQQGKKTSAPADDATAERLKRAEAVYS